MIKFLDLEKMNNRFREEIDSKIKKNFDKDWHLQGEENKIFEENFDLIFSIGEACSCTQILRKCRLQFFSYPFDWLYGSDIITRAKIIANDYNDFIKIEDLEDLNRTNEAKVNLCEIYKNKRNNICFNHDFEYGIPLEKAFPEVENKYKRRISRQLNQIEKSEKILVVCLQTPTATKEISNEELIEVLKILKERFKNKNIKLLHLYCNRANKKPIPQKTNEYITKICFDYDAYNKDFPYLVNNQTLQKVFCKLKITNKFITPKNIIRRYLYLTKCFLRRML